LQENARKPASLGHYQSEQFSLLGRRQFPVRSAVTVALVASDSVPISVRRHWVLGYKWDAVVPMRFEAFSFGSIRIDWVTYVGPAGSEAPAAVARGSNLQLQTVLQQSS
jgi:hypothetical protein